MVVGCAPFQPSDNVVRRVFIDRFVGIRFGSTLE